MEPDCALVKSWLVAQSMPMSTGEAQFRMRPRPGVPYGAGKFLRLSDLRTLRKCEKVAAVCFRIRAGILEFLLVQTRGGRWTFPKGNAEPGLTTAQAAALEAFEEAGVHGRMEEGSFATYVRRKNGGGANPGMDLMITAHLCQVLWLEPPPESGRNPTWFSIEKAKRRLRENRSGNYGAELARVVNQAAGRIKQLRSRPLVAPLSRVIDVEDIQGSLRVTKALPPAREKRRSKSRS